jgi:hypothetical protein
MKFARTVFWIAGIYGILSLPPLYFLFDYVGRTDPPPITHPQFYYGFAGVGIAFQFVFILIATNPARYRPMIAPSVLEKLSYVAACAVLHGQGRITFAEAATAFPDSIFLLLFLAAFFMTAPVKAGNSSRVWIPNVRIP